MSIILDGTTGITTPDLIDSSLTSGRVVYAGTSGNLTGSDNLTFSGTTITLKTGYYEAYDPTDSTSAGVGMRFYTNGGGTKVENGRLVVSQSGTGSALSSMIFQTNNGTTLAEQMRLTGAGRLGIGTSSPSVKLEVSGSDSILMSKVTSTNTAGQAASQLATNQAAFYTAAFGSTAGGTTWAGLTGSGQVVIEAQTSTSFVIGAFNNSAPIIFAQGRAEVARIDVSGNVVIGSLNDNVASANQKLLIAGSPEGATLHGIFIHNNSYSAASARIALSPRYSFLYNTSPYIQAVSESTSAAALTFGTTTGGAVSERARIDSSGNFILNTTSSIAKFNVGASIASSYPTYSNPSSGGYSGGFFASTLNSSDNYLVLLDIGSVCAGTDATNGGSAIRFLTQSRVSTFPVVERARIDQNGNLLVGTTTSAGKFTGDIGSSTFTSGTASAFLNWKSSSGSGGRPCIQVQSLSVGEDSAFRNAVYDGTNSIYWTIGQNIASSAGNLDFGYQSVAGTQTTNSGTIAVRFTSAGQIYNITGTYGTISDAKLKENITDATPKLADLMRLQVRNFNLKADATKAKQLGFIAQEIQQVFPACVEAFDDIDQETKEKTGETLTVKTAILIPMLVKAMQEQQAILESLKARLDAANL
jgi:hypothetical protein